MCVHANRCACTCMCFSKCACVYLNSCSDVSTLECASVCVCVRVCVFPLCSERPLWMVEGLLQRSGQMQRPSAITSILHAKNSLHNYTQLGKCMFLWRGPRPIIPSSRLAAFIKIIADDQRWVSPDVTFCTLFTVLAEYPFQIKAF